MIDEQKVFYEIKSNKVFAKKRSTTTWIEAKKFLEEAIADSRKRTAGLKVFYDGEFRGYFPVTNATVMEKPILEPWVDHEQTIRRAIDLKAQACVVNDELVVYFIDRDKAKISGDFRSTRRIKRINSLSGKTYWITTAVDYATKDEVEQLKKQVQ